MFSHLPQQRNAGKAWWRVLLLGLAAYVEALLLSVGGNLHFMPLMMLLAGAIVPVTFVVYCWERCTVSRMPAAAVGLAFLSGAVLGVLGAAVLESLFLLPIPFVAPFTIGVIEEGAKALAVLLVIWLLCNGQVRGELNGLVLGAAAGAGFAAVETAGYGFASFLDAYTTVVGHGSLLAPALNAGIVSMTSLLLVRMALAVFMHGTWTAIICAALWRESRGGKLRITWGVVLAFAISVALHAAWDAVSAPLGLLAALLVMPLVGLPALWILRFFTREGVERELFGVAAPPPAPILRAFAIYLVHPWRRQLLGAAQSTVHPPLASGAPMPIGIATGAPAGSVRPFFAPWSDIARAPDAPVTYEVAGITHQR